MAQVVEFDPRLCEHHRRPRVSRRGPDLACEWGRSHLSWPATPSWVVAGGWGSVSGGPTWVRTTGWCQRERTIAVVSTTTVSLSASRECRSGGMTSRSPL